MYILNLDIIEILNFRFYLYFIIYIIINQMIVYYILKDDLFFIFNHNDSIISKIL